MAMSITQQRKVLAGHTLERQLKSIVYLYDMAQSNKRSYNPFALGIYNDRVDRIVAEVEAGEDPQVCINRGFNDRLLDYINKRVVL
jgi:hypothetical protein